MWHREDEVRRQNPDLIISHLSSLLEARAADAAIEERLFDVAERRLTLFLGYIATDNPRTRFMVYSRGHFATADVEASWVANVVARFPQLKRAAVHAAGTRRTGKRDVPRPSNRADVAQSSQRHPPSALSGRDIGATQSRRSGLAARATARRAPASTPV